MKLRPLVDRILTEEREVLKFENLVGGNFVLQIGSSGTSYTNWSDADLLAGIEKAIMHNLFDWNFYYNETDHKAEYFNTFKRDTLLPMTKKQNINKTLKNFFEFDNRKRLTFTVELDSATKYIDKWFISNKSISNELKSDYYKFRKRYAGVTL